MTMVMKQLKKSLKNESELMQRCRDIEGLSFAQLAKALETHVPVNPIKRKGWVGQAIELALGTTAGNKAVPDFHELGIEVKTLPVNHLGKSAESTYVTNIPLLTIHNETWATSQCYSKLKRVLWLPVEADECVPFPHRRIGQGILWSPSDSQADVLQSDWEELTSMIALGQLNEIDSTIGQYLQIRPKAANAKSLCYGFDEHGNKVQTLPRGFYLRASFTSLILSS